MWVWLVGVVELAGGGRRKGEADEKVLEVIDD